MDLYRVKPREARRLIDKTLRAGRVPMVTSSPGMGKSSLFRAVAKDWRLRLIDHRLSTSAPEDLSGLPEFYTTPDGLRKARFVPFDIFPCADTPIPEGYDGWLLFFDEFNSGTKMVQAACYKTILDRYVGQTPLNDCVAMGAAGNLMTDRAITNNLSTAMQSRMIHIELELDFDQWLMDVAIRENYDERIIAYLSYDHDELMDFRPDHQDKTFNCPRTWEFMNDLVQGEESLDQFTPLFAGTISSGSAAKFVQFCKVYKTLMSVKDVLANPTGAPVPINEPEKAWALVSHLTSKLTDKNFDDLSTYVDRMDMTMRVLFYRGAMMRHPKLRTHPAFARAMVTLQRYLKDDDDHMQRAA